MRHTRGFTLIELTLVLLILGILAGLVVPMAGWIRRSANYANSTNNQGTLLSNMELFRVSFGNNSYPNRFDSLLTSGGTPPSYMDSTFAAMLSPGALETGEFESINNSGRGLSTVMDFTDPLSGAIEGNPGNGATIARNYVAAGNLAVINTSLYDEASTSGPNVNVTQLAKALGYVPDNTNTGKFKDAGTADGTGSVRLVVLGIGPSNTANGRTMQTPPFDTNVDNSKVYNRFSAVFAVYSPREGRRAQLKAILCPRGRIINRNLSEFYQSTNPE